LITRPRVYDWSWLALLPAILLLVGLLIVPAAFGLFNTFTDSTPTRGAWHFVGLANYGAVLSDSTLGTAFGNALLLAAVTVTAEIAGGLVIAGLLRRPFRGRSLVRALLLAPWLLSPLAAGVMWHFLYNSQVGITGWLADLIGKNVGSPLADPNWSLISVFLVEAWRMTPLAAFLLLPGVLAVPQDELDQARILGSSLLTTWTRVIIPRLRPLLLTVLLLLVAESLTTFDSILVLTGGGPGSRTSTPALYAYNTAIGGHNWPLGAAASWLLATPIIVIGIAYVALMRMVSGGELA